MNKRYEVMIDFSSHKDQSKITVGTVLTESELNNHGYYWGKRSPPNLVATGILKELPSEELVSAPALTTRQKADISELEHNAKIQAEWSEFIEDCENQAWERYGLRKDALMEARERDPTIKPHAPSTAQFLYTVAVNHASYFKDQYGECYALITHGRVVKQIPTTSSDFDEWLSGQFKEHFDKIVSTSTITNLKVLLASEAKKKHYLYNRCAEYKGKFYYDLANDDWDVVEIDSAGWRITKAPVPLFRRYSHQLEAKIERDITRTPNQIFEEYFKIHPPLSQDNTQFQACLIPARFLPNVPVPCDIIHGAENSGKSTATRFLTTITDPNITPILSLKTDDLEQVKLQLSQRWHIGFDNTTWLPQELSDTLCQYITGGYDIARQLYTDSDIKVKRLFGRATLNGRPAVASASDLMRRSKLQEQISLEKDTVIDEKELQERFDAILPFLRAAIFDVLVVAMNILPKIKRKSASLPEFSKWGEAISRVLGYPEDTFIEINDRSGIEQAGDSLYAHPIGHAITLFLDDTLNKAELEQIGEIKKPVSEFYESLRALATEEERRLKGFPKASNKVQKSIVEILRPIKLLRHTNIEFTKERTNNYILFKKVKSMSTTSTSPQTKLNLGGDGVDITPTMSAEIVVCGDTKPSTSTLMSTPKKEQIYDVVKANPLVNAASIMGLVGETDFDQLMKFMDVLKQERRLIENSPDRWVAI